MFDINGWEFIILAVLALLVLGPDKLPRYIAEAGRMIRQVRRMADDARTEVTRELGPEFKDISLDDLNPRSFVRKHLFDGADPDLGLDFDLDDDTHADRRPATPSAPRQREPADPGPSLRKETPVTEASVATPPYDADAT